MRVDWSTALLLVCVAGSKVFGETSGKRDLFTYEPVNTLDPEMITHFRDAMKAAGQDGKGVTILSMFHKNEVLRSSYRASYKKMDGKECSLDWRVYAINNVVTALEPTCGEDPKKEKISQKTVTPSELREVTPKIEDQPKEERNDENEVTKEPGDEPQTMDAHYWQLRGELVDGQEYHPEDDVDDFKEEGGSIWDLVGMGYP